MIIYVCYSSKDSEIAQTLSVELGLLGHDVLFEQKFVGNQVRWHDVFTNIASCDLFVFAVSIHALRSYSCDLEYGYANALNLQILPVLVEALGNTSRAQHRSMLPYVEWYAQNFSQDALAIALSQLSPRQSYPAIPPFHPDLTTPLARLRDEVISLPDSIESQGFLLDNAVEFLEREDTFANASSILRAMQVHPRVSPVIAQEIERTSDLLTKSRAQRTAARRRARWVRDIALVLGGALGVLILVRGFLFLRPYLGLDAAGTPEVTVESVESAPVSGLSATETPTPAPTNTEAPTVVPENTIALIDIAERQTQSAIQIENAVATAALSWQSTATAAIATAFARVVPTSTSMPTATAIPSTMLPSSTLPPVPTSTRAPTSTLTPTLLPSSTVMPSPTFTPSPTVDNSTPVVMPTAAPVEYVGLSVEDTSVGVRIIEVGETAALAGVRVDDYVLSVDTTIIHNRVEFLDLLSTRQPFTAVTFRLRREASDLYIRVTLALEDFRVATTTTAP